MSKRKDNPETRNKVDNNEVQKFLQDHNLSTNDKYESQYKNMHIQCMFCGHNFLASWKRLTRNKISNKCPGCRISYKMSEGEVLQRLYILDSIDYKLVKPFNYLDYIDYNQIFEVECNIGHIYQTTIKKITIGYKCSVCADNHLYTISGLKEKGKEILGLELISTSYSGVNDKLEWECKNGHTIIGSWSSLKQNVNACNICWERSIFNIDMFKLELEKRGFNYISGEYQTNRSKIEVKCPNLHVYTTDWFRFVTNRYGCPYCNVNKPEGEIFEFIKSIYPGLIIQRDRSVLKMYEKGGYELDFYLPELKLAIEHNGLYWHSENLKGKTYHFDKREACEQNGIKLIMINEDEWLDKKDIVKSIISNAIGVSESIYARSCEIRVLTGREYFEKNHLMGYTSAKQIALVYKDQTVAAMSYKVVKNELHIIRFCNSLNIRVVGGFSKLLNFIQKETNIKIVVNFVDLRYGSTKAYNNLGFWLEGITNGWKWTDFKNTYNRLQCRANMDSRRLTQKQHAEELGWVKIYDAGQAKLVKNIS